ncbi:MAG: thiamine-phosphate kinase, partial [Candidatus Omnitrophica bacterium]|nr:thiamine-phosphate kinase [Candidatus Omnitrophota bacterium]
LRRFSPHCLISLGMPKDTTVKFLDRVFKGMAYMAAKFKINIAGGDLSRAKQLAIDVSMLGIVEKKYLVLRSGAKNGDIIFVTGALGGSIKGKHLKFIPRLKEARLLVKNFKVNAMIDISDGLAQDLGHILKQSNCGALLYEGLIPFSKEAKGLNDALYSGEDFELLFTLPHEQAKKLSRKNYLRCRPIGEITEKKYGLTLIDKRGREKVIKPEGFRHF